MLVWLREYDSGKLYDVRLPDGHAAFGPFDSVGCFHEVLPGGMSVLSVQIPEVNKLVEIHKKAQFSTCFIHGDLYSMNILFSGDTIT